MSELIFSLAGRRHRRRHAGLRLGVPEVQAEAADSAGRGKLREGLEGRGWRYLRLWWDNSGGCQNCQGNHSEYFGTRVPQCSTSVAQYRTSVTPECFWIWICKTNTQSAVTCHQWVGNERYLTLVNSVHCALNDVDWVHHIRHHLFPARWNVTLINSLSLSDDWHPDIKHGHVPVSTVSYQIRRVSTCHFTSTFPTQPRPRVDVNLIVGIIPPLTLTAHILSEMGLISRSPVLLFIKHNCSVWGISEQPISN